MSVINSMLRDLDRRHAPLPFKTHVQPAFENNSRARMRAPALLCALVLIGAGLAFHATQKYRVETAAVIDDRAASPMQQPIAETATSATSTTASNSMTTAPAMEKNPEAATIDAEPATKSAIPTAALATAAVETPVAVAEKSIAPAADNRAANAVSASDVAIVKNQSRETSISEISDAKENDAVTHANTATKVASVNAKSDVPAPIVKQERRTDDVNAERYQLARAALAQNQPARAYELLRDTPPRLADAIDYHAVLAAVEQQLGHYADAGARYRQLLTLDETQASWWLGLALSLDGEHRNAEAFAAYRRAAMLNSLPDAARQYTLARMAALAHSAE